MPNKTNPTTSYLFFFVNNGYLVLENLLKENHVEILLDKLHQVIEQRRNAEKNGTTKTGMTSIDGDNTRIFYILDDDPLFLDMIDLPEIWPYIIGFLNEKPHHHASDAIVEYAPKGRNMVWHIDGHDEGYRRLGTPIPFLQLKIGYYLTDMTERGQ